jgi:hypothetical protein
MKLPPKSPTLEAAKDKLHEHYVVVERQLTREADQLANSGFASKHWCSIARQHFEEGVMALHRALRDAPMDDPNEYGKTPGIRPYPVPPPVDTLPSFDEARRIMQRGPKEPRE